MVCASEGRSEGATISFEVNSVCECPLAGCAVGESSKSCFFFLFALRIFHRPSPTPLFHSGRSEKTDTFCPSVSATATSEASLLNAIAAIGKEETEPQKSTESVGMSMM